MIPEAARQILREVAIEHRLNRDEILGRLRWPEFVAARIDVAHRLRERGYSMPRIGAVLGRHHSTIIYYFKRDVHVTRKKSTAMAKRKITPAQCQELLRLYSEQGYAASSAYARQIGVSPNYASVLAHRELKPKIDRRIPRKSGKWQRAVEIGPVVV